MSPGPRHITDVRYARRPLSIAPRYVESVESVETTAPDSVELYRQQLAQERDRLSLLLNLTNRITSNLDLHDLLRAISATLRQVMECDGDRKSVV